MIQENPEINDQIPDFWNTRKKTKTIRWYPCPVPPLTLYYKSTSPILTTTPFIICNNNKIDIAFLVQMRQSNKCRSARNDKINGFC